MLDQKVLSRLTEYNDVIRVPLSQACLGPPTLSPLLSKTVEMCKALDMNCMFPKYVILNSSRYCSGFVKHA